MSFSDAIGQVDQIVQWEQQLASPAALTQPSGTAATGTTANTGSSDSASSSSFSDALAQAQSQEGTSALSVLDSADAGTDPSSDSSDSTDSSSLLSGGDSQLLSALQSASNSTSADGTVASGTDSASSSALISELESALGSAGSDDTDDTGATTDGTDSSSELTALVQALENSSATGSTASAGLDTTSATFGSAATSAADPRVESMIQEANSLIGKPYVWGGGHNNFGPQSGYDCSGFVSAVLHAGGYLTSPQDTETLPSAAGMESGPGQYVTVYDRTTPDQEGHVIIEIDGQFYESGGQSGSWGGGGGVEKIATPSASYLATFNTILHPEGL
jgi:cell wall-associated NlpC family hydrolase